MDAENREKLLEEALTAYTAVEPREGLEGRVLTRVGVAESRLPNRSWWWSGAAACCLTAAALLAFIFYRPLPHLEQPSFALGTPVPSQVKLLPTHRRIQISSISKSKTRVVLTAEKNKPFEEPPLSKQERLLLAAANKPFETQPSPADTDITTVSPIEISLLAFQEIAFSPLHD